MRQPHELGIIVALLLANSSPAVAHQSDDVVFAGRLTGSAVDTIIKKLSVSPQSRLVITSAGGEDAAGASLGEYIYQNRTPVVVRDLCLSACANTLLMAAPSVDFEPGAVVGMHHSAVSIVQSYRRLGEAPPPDLAHAANIQEAIYRARAGGVALLECSAEKVGQMDHYIERANPDGEIRRLFGLRLRWWIPDQSNLESMGVAVRNGRVNENPERIALRLNVPAAEITFGTARDCL